MYDNVALVRAKGYTYFATPYNKLRSTRIPTQFAGSYEGNDKGHTGIIAFAISLSQIQLKLDNPHRHIDDPKWIFEVMYAFKTVFFKSEQRKKKILIYALINISSFENNNIPMYESLFEEILTSHLAQKSEINYLLQKQSYLYITEENKKSHS